VTLGIIAVAAFIVSLDTTVLNVAIPTILRDFHTTLPSLQWVITGYALTFATLLIIGGRLGDIYGHRRMFILGAALFAVGSFIASESGSVPVLVAGEAVIEGIGASLMLPATLAILSLSFDGHERTAAFGVWGAVGGAASTLGPVVGGFLTTNYSWRWSFRINVIIAPAAILGALLVMPRGKRSDPEGHLDVPGAALIALGMLLLVFGFSDGGMYGWWHPIAPFTIAGHAAWPVSASLSPIPVAVAVACVLLTGFYFTERRKERRGLGPLFEFGQLRHRAFRWGLITVTVLAIGQFALAIVLPVFLQEGKHLSAERNGLWQLPTGVFVFMSAPLGGRLARRIGVTRVVRIGIALLAVAFMYTAAVMTASLGFWTLMPALALFGVGIGFAITQLTNVVLYDVDPDKSGVASGANTTARQVGFAIGVAIMESMLNTETVSGTASRIGSAALPAAVKVRALAALHSTGVNFAPPPGVGGQAEATLRHAFVAAVSAASRVPLLFAAGMALLASGLSLLLPRVGTTLRRRPVPDFDSLAVVEPDPAMLTDDS